MRHIYTLIIVLIINISCKRDHLYYATNDKVLVTVNIDWDSAKLSPNGVTALAYNSDGSLYRQFPPFTNTDSVVLALPEGSYDIVLFNNTPSEFKYIDFINMGNMKTAQAINKEYVTSKLDLNSGGNIIIGANPDTLATAMVGDVNITKLLIDYSYHRPEKYNISSILSYDATAVRRTYLVEVFANVKGLKYLASAPYFNTLYTYNGCFLDSTILNSTPVIQEFKLNNRKFTPGSNTDGTLSAEFTSFGLPTDSTVILSSDLTLLNGEIYHLELDVTPNIEYVDGYQPKIIINIEFELPEVSGDISSGFATDLEDWDHAHVDLPL